MVDLVSKTLLHVVGVPPLPVPEVRESVMTSPLLGLLVVFLYVGLVLLVSGTTYAKIEAPFRAISRAHAPRFSPMPAELTAR